MLQKVYYRKKSDAIKAQNEIEDERLKTLITQDPLVNIIYEGYQQGIIDYEEMLIQMVCNLAEAKRSLSQLYIEYMENIHIPEKVYIISNEKTHD